MLRASADAIGVTIDLRAVADRATPSGRTDADALLGFTDALVGRTDRLEDARAQLVEQLGVEAVPPAAAVAGNFEMMNRIVDAVGVPISPRLRAIAPEIGLPPGGDGATG